jgi:hypothetical protein
VTANAITPAHIGAVGPEHSKAVAATWMMAAKFFWKNCPTAANTGFQKQPRKQ